MKQRDLSIDILKFIACIAITNSHFDKVYGPLSSIATGGAIGDILFFFASGFTIFLSNRGGQFFDYYKRRINRIYPTVFAWALMSGIIFGSDESFLDVLLYGGGWFVSCIMIYYIAFYFIRKYLFNHLKSLLIIFVLFSMGLYFVWEKPEHFNIYAGTYYKWVHYFMFMLQGAIIGLIVKEKKMSDTKACFDIPMLIISIVAFFALFSFKSSNDLNFIQIFSFMPLLGVAYYTYRLCRTKAAIHLLDVPVIGKIIKVVGGLCLEIYICQMFLLKFDPLMSVVTSSFPFGIILISLTIFITAYLMNCLSKIWVQTFNEGDYDWRKIVKVI